jgi:hypothetical protein
MNTNDIRHIDYDVYRERAHALRRQAISEMLEAATAWLASLPARISSRAQGSGRSARRTARFAQTSQC